MCGRSRPHAPYSIGLSVYRVIMRTPAHPTYHPTYKAIVLFTPGGDVFYTIDQDKTRHWHFDLCLAIQSLLKLKEAPHFLVPYYTATIDVGVDPVTDLPQVLAEAHPLVYRYRYFLNALFDLDRLERSILPKGIQWKSMIGATGGTAPAFLEHYAQQFPQLWQGHNWVVPLDQVVVLNRAIVTQPPPVSQKQSPEASAHLSEQPDHPGVDGYVLRLFVSGHGSQTEQSLKELHQFLKQGLAAPYSLKVIDICRYPELAEQDQITAVPTLVRIWPKPVRRIVGHLHHRDQLMQLLQPNTLVLGERSGRSLG